MFYFDLKQKNTYLVNLLSDFRKRSSKDENWNGFIDAPILSDFFKDVKLEVLK